LIAVLSEVERRVLGYVESHRDEAVAYLQRLVRVDT